MDPFDVFDSGRMTVAQIRPARIFGVWQAGQHHGAQLANEPGSVNWNEVPDADAAAAARFYRPSSATRSSWCRWATGCRYRVLKVEGTDVAGIFEITERHGRHAAELVDRFRRRRHRRACSEGQGAGRRGARPADGHPGIGRFAVLQDPAGAVFQVLAPPPPE